MLGPTIFKLTLKNKISGSSFPEITVCGLQVIAQIFWPLNCYFHLDHVVEDTMKDIHFIFIN